MPTPLYPSVQIRRFPMEWTSKDENPVYDLSMEKVEVSSILRKEFIGVWYRLLIKTSAKQTVGATTEYVLLTFMEEAYKTMHLGGEEILNIRDKKGFYRVPDPDQRSEAERLTELYGNNQ